MRVISIMLGNQIPGPISPQAINQCAQRRYAFSQEWCHRDISGSVLSPRLFRHEDLPAGPAWPDVQRIIAANQGSSQRELRNRAILLLLAVYGLRISESLRLEISDVDLRERLLCIRQSKFFKTAFSGRTEAPP